MNERRATAPNPSRQAIGGGGEIVAGGRGKAHFKCIVACLRLLSDDLQVHAGGWETVSIFSCDPFRRPFSRVAQCLSPVLPSQSRRE